MVENSMPDIDFVLLLNNSNDDERQQMLTQVNQELETLTAPERVAWAVKNLPDTQILSSSFGIQAAVMLRMLTLAKPEIPVVLTDTGYLFTETYDFIDELTERLNLNLKVYRSELSPAWQEHRYGKLWEKGLEGIQQYNKLNKVEPMQRALTDLDAKVWFTGLRRDQSSSRANLDVLQISGGRYKFNPIADWTNRDVHFYLKEHTLPYHPLWDKGYVSVGDWHTSRPLELGMSEEETRFFGLKRECGLHEGGSGI